MESGSLLVQICDRVVDVNEGLSKLQGPDYLVASSPLFNPFCLAALNTGILLSAGPLPVTLMTASRQRCCACRTVGVPAQRDGPRRCSLT
eukprot:359613-Chlamydomonas_euryale.AAC.6